MSKGSFSDAIADHLELQRRNCQFEPSMPIEQYRQAAPPAPSGPDQPTQPVSVHEILARDPASWWEAQEGTEPKFNWD
jgi:hypothetical protein